MRARICMHVYMCLYYVCMYYMREGSDAKLLKEVMRRRKDGEVSEASEGKEGGKGKEKKEVTGRKRRR